MATLGPPPSQLHLGQAKLEMDRAKGKVRCFTMVNKGLIERDGTCSTYENAATCALEGDGRKAKKKAASTALWPFIPSLLVMFYYW